MPQPLALKTGATAASAGNGSTTRRPPGRWRRRIGTVSVFAILTAVMTWPQALVISTHAVSHHDVLFNLWRLRWVAHALAAAPLGLFDGNVFYPEPLALTLSDAMLVEGLIAAPLFWIGLPPVLVHNLMLLGAIVASGVGIYVLAEHLSGSRAGALAAGIVFAFAPYRFEHYMHMELQWAVWTPWAFWALQRTLETASWRYGVLTGAFVAVQLLSSIYYGVFLAVLLPVVGAVQLLARVRREVLALLQRLAIGAAVAAAIAALYAVPYSRTSSRVGDRSAVEVTAYSAKPKDYLTATSSNLLYGSRAAGLPERRLFPGVVAPLLALVGLLLVTPRPAGIAYLIGGALAFELSLGMYGLAYPVLFEHGGPFQALRAPARASIFCLVCLAVLTAQGMAALLDSLPTVLRRAAAVIVPAVLVLEYWVAPLGLVAYANRPPLLYEWLAGQPDGVVAEFPMPRTSSLPGRDPVYSYMSTFHWKPLVNGYSGYYPRSYLQRLDALAQFPDARAIERLRSSRVRYVVVHADAYSSVELERIVAALTASGAETLGQFDDGVSHAVVFRMR